MTIRQDYGDIDYVDISFSATGTSAGGPATATSSKGDHVPKSGTITGGIVENGPGINLTFTEDVNAAGGRPSYNFAGSIREHDLIAGGAGPQYNWSTLGPMA